MEVPTPGTQTTKLGFHEDIVAPFIGLVAVSTIAWVIVLVLLAKDKDA